MGQIGSAMGNKNTFAPDPSGFSGSEWAARFMGGAGKGALQGASNMQQQNQQLRQPGGNQVDVSPFMQQPSMPDLIPQQPAPQRGDVYNQPRARSAFYGQ